MIRNNNIKKYLLLLFLTALLGCRNDVKTKEMDVNSGGQFSSTNKRIGDWKYYDDNGNLIASGSYTDGLKEGLWNYSKKLYNNSQTIDWEIYSNSLFKINIPKDWEINTSAHINVPLVFIYKDSIRPNGNITLIKKDSSLTLKEAANELIRQSNIGNNHKVLLQKEVAINGLNSVYSQQLMSIEGKDLALEQYLIEGINHNYIISFFVTTSHISLYNQLFTEIAYSFTENS